MVYLKKGQMRVAKMDKNVSRFISNIKFARYCIDNEMSLEAYSHRLLYCSIGQLAVFQENGTCGNLFTLHCATVKLVNQSHWLQVEILLIDYTL